MKKSFWLLLVLTLFLSSKATAQSFSIEAGLTNFFGMPGIAAGVFLPTEPTGMSGGRIQVYFASDGLNALGFIGGTGKTGWVFGARSEVLIGQSLLPLVGLNADYLGAYAKLGVSLMIGNISSAGGGLLTLPVGLGLEAGAGILLQIPKVIGAFFEIEAGFLLPVQWYATLNFGLRLRIS
ncbi:MAG: hypothetical protein RLZZ156_2880 [Deinococcota bacterium]|jgi:hypothetical protein